MPTDVLVSPDEYLARERASDRKHEYHRGRIVPAAGANVTRALIITNVAAALGRQLRDTDGRVFASNLRVGSGDGALFAYPDVAVTAGTPRCADEREDVLLNPAVVIDVLSTAARSGDRGGRSGNYRAVDSLRDYVLIDPEQRHAAHFTRRDDGRWQLTEIDDPSTKIELSSVEAELTLADVYHKTEPDAEPDAGLST